MLLQEVGRKELFRCILGTTYDCLPDEYVYAVGKLLSADGIEVHLLIRNIRKYDGRRR